MKYTTEALFALLLAGGAVILGRLVSVQPTGLPLYFVIGFLAVGLSLLDMRIALGFLAMAMLLSPEIPVAAVPRRDVVIRFDDLLLILIFISWTAKQALNKKLPLIKASPLNKYILYYLAACFMFTGKGILMGHADYRQAIFYLFKYLEYFLIFWMTYNVIQKKEDLKILLKFFFFTAVIVIIHSYFIFPGRMHAPFDPGEPASAGGYFIIIAGLSLGLAIFHSLSRAKIFFISLFILVIPLVITTQSRASYAALPVTYIIIALLSNKYKKRLLLAGIGALFLVPAVLGGGLYSTLAERVSYTFSGRYGALGLDPSSAARVISWQAHLTRNWPRMPLTGWGVTGRGFIDSQYVRTLVELGVIGFWLFILLKYKIMKFSVNLFRSLEEGWGKGLVLGFAGAFGGLLIHAVTTNTFIIVRVMGPFWFILAMVTALPAVDKLKIKDS